MPRDLKVFISSPGDVLAERNAADRILAEVQRSAAWRSKVTFQVIRWDDPIAAAPMDAKLAPQSALNTVLPVPSACDITVVILWSRLGTLVADLHKADGRAYGSGTEWEFCDALKGAGGVYLFNNPGPPTAAIDDPLLAERQTQYKAVRAFIAGLKDADGANRHSYRTYSNVPEFEKLFEETIEGHLRLLDERSPLQAAEASGVLDARISELLKGVELVDDYKAAHDQLHLLEFECYGRIDCNLDHIGESDQRWDELSEIADKVDEVVVRLGALAQRLAPARPGFKLADLEKGAHLLRDSVSHRDPLKLQECRNTLASILRRFPSQIVVEMNSAAQRVMTVLAALRGGQSSGALEDVGKRLERLIWSHDRWQRFDFALSTTNPQTQVVDSWWPNVQDLAEPLFTENPDAAISRVRAALEELGVTITQNVPAITSKFQALRSRTGVAFSRVDSDLKSYCTELRRVDGQFSILRHAS